MAMVSFLDPRSWFSSQKAAKPWKLEQIKSDFIIHQDNKSKVRISFICYQSEQNIQECNGLGPLVQLLKKKGKTNSDLFPIYVIYMDSPDGDPEYGTPKQWKTIIDQIYGNLKHRPVHPKMIVWVTPQKEVKQALINNSIYRDGLLAQLL